MADPELVYFVPVRGRAQARFGSDQFIGCRLSRATGKLEWLRDEPVGIGKTEHQRYLREYAAAVRRGDLQAVSVAPLAGGGSRVTVLPGGPVPTEKNGLRAANESWPVGVPAAAAAPAPEADSRKKAAPAAGH